MIKKNRTLKKQVRRLLQLTIISVTVLGCLIYSAVMLTYIRMNHLNQLNYNLEHLYNEVVTESELTAIHQTEILSEIIMQKEGLTKENLQTDDDIHKNSHGVETWIFGRENQLLYSNTTHPIELIGAEINKLLQNKGGWYAGNLESGIFVYAANNVYHHELVDYVITRVNISNEQYIERINKDFDIDASIFYHNIRLITSVQNSNVDAKLTILDPDIFKKVVESNEIVKGNSNVIGTRYLAAYKSFGNPGEFPVGVIGVGKPVSEYFGLISGMLVAITLIGIILIFVITVFSRRWMVQYVIEPIQSTIESLVNINEGHNNFRDTIHRSGYLEEFNQLNQVIYNLLLDLEVSEQRIEKIAFYNELTLLPNRFLLLKKWMGHQNTLINGCALYMDIDNLKFVNDLLGHKVGDKLIKGVAGRLSETISNLEHYELYHFGGGEFVVFVGRKVENARMENIANGIIESFKEPFYLDSNVFNSTITIGIASVDSSTTTAEQVVHNAGVAMDHIKKKSKGRYLFYSEEILDQMKQYIEFEEDLKNALVNQEFFLVYQPKLDLVTGKCKGMEALIRWNSPKRGLVSPLDFIQVAEETGLIIDMGQWVLEEVCRFIKRLESKFNEEIKVSCNVSTLQIIKEDFVKSVLSTLLHHQVKPECIELELTESVLIEYLSTAVEKLRRLNALGVDIAIDDFGKGYSSLAYLRKLPINSLKIDKMFIDDLIETKDLLVGDIIKLGHHMNLKVIAEGVEEQEQVDFLREAGCDCIQGYYYSKPLKEEDIYTFLDQEAQKE